MSAAVIVVSLVAIWAGSWDAASSDFGTEAWGPLSALLHGNIAGFLSGAPSYGPSLLLRAPFALPASLLGAHIELIYRLMALPCLVALGLLGVWLAIDLRRAGGQLLAALAGVALCAANPITYRALQLGHPEELLGAALCVAAVLLAQRGRINWAALALGLAVANKEWAVLAVGPVLLAAPSGRIRIVAISGAIAAALLLPMTLSAPLSATQASGRFAAVTGPIFNPWQILWFFARHGDWNPHAGIYIPRGFRLPPAWIGNRAHELIVASALPLTWAAFHRRASRGDALLLLALLLLVRCWLDPWDVVYYPLPFIVALAAWELSVMRRFPLAALLATIVVVLDFWYLPPYLSQNALALGFIIPSTLALAVMAGRIYRLRARRPALAGARALRRVPVAPS
ncbi:MAG TPA: hypothetical protein VHX66_15640 [Solirubrobacteraceae bacterium]|jgi:hypothetical protein|nr:hypothetical protein [Solirubrobacteraceae bacterium]